jgi:ATP-GRASP peptide maturase of grasp-with-spasm system
MILIFSTARDLSTLDVMQWIQHLDSEAKVLRINSDEQYRIGLTLEDDDFSVALDEEAFRLSDVSSAWLRKGDFWFKGLFQRVESSPSSVFTAHLNEKLHLENRRLREHFHHLLRKHSHVLGSANGSTPNKMVALDLAREVGLRTPSFSVTTSRSQAQGLLDSGRKYVSKAASDGLYLFDTTESRSGYFTYTEAVSPSHVAGLEESVPPSLFQEYIEKEFELRIFFLDDVFHAAAIFSQRDARTQVDYRKYNYERPNRVVPFTLPEEVTDKLSRLAARLDLNTGSIDMIVDKAGEYYFLEVNPVGQFGPNSAACNQSIECLIARRLLAHERRAQTAAS